MVADELAVVVAAGELTAWDLCDRCGFQASILITLPGELGGELLFCEHHEREHWPSLSLRGAIVTKGRLHPFAV